MIRGRLFGLKRSLNLCRNTLLRSKNHIELRLNNNKKDVIEIEKSRK